ncbi:MAG: hypothetical protein ACE368_13855 [Paracoccaceae bacterium]
MKRFAALFAALDRTTRTTVKTAALAAYFRSAPDRDKLWTIALLSGRRPRRTVTTTALREWAAERAGIPLWLSRNAIPSSATWPRPSPLSCRPPAAPRTNRSVTG